MLEAGDNGNGKSLELLTEDVKSILWQRYLNSINQSTYPFTVREGDAMTLVRSRTFQPGDKVEVRQPENEMSITVFTGVKDVALGGAVTQLWDDESLKILTKLIGAGLNYNTIRKNLLSRRPLPFDIKIFLGRAVSEERVTETINESLDLALTELEADLNNKDSSIRDIGKNETLRVFMGGLSGIDMVPSRPVEAVIDRIENIRGTKVSLPYYPTPDRPYSISLNFQDGLSVKLNEYIGQYRLMNIRA